MATFGGLWRRYFACGALCARAGRYVHPIHRSYDSWILKCNRHPACEKKRVVSVRNCARHGHLEPLAYVLAWRDVHLPDGATAKQHINVRGLPTPEAVANIMELHREALQECRDKFPL